MFGWITSFLGGVDYYVSIIPKNELNAFKGSNLKHENEQKMSQFFGIFNVNGNALLNVISGYFKILNFTLAIRRKCDVDILINDCCNYTCNHLDVPIYVGENIWSD